MSGLFCLLKENFHLFWKFLCSAKVSVFLTHVDSVVTVPLLLQWKL